MNKRLLSIASLVDEGIGLLDVGTDHGYLPLYLAQNGYPGALLASDINPGPLQSAIRNAAAAGLSHRIRFSLCDGLDNCDPAAFDTIVIAGMGGDTICGILDRAEWCMDPRYTLILQPMTKGEVLRYWLSNNMFHIDREVLTEDAGELYSVLRARFGSGDPLCDGELYTGAFSLVKNQPLWPAFRAAQLHRLEKALGGMRQSGREPGRRSVLETAWRQIREVEA